MGGRSSSSRTSLRSFNGDVDVGTAKPLPARFVWDWLRGQSGETRLMVRDDELHVFTARFEAVVDEEQPSPDEEEPQP
jgi:hypothetical protein